jgi:hypothetical protein
MEPRNDQAQDASRSKNSRNASPPASTGPAGTRVTPATRTRRRGTLGQCHPEN